MSKNLTYSLSGYANEAVTDEAATVTATLPPMDGPSLVAELEKRMRVGVALFVFAKKDGTKRFAVGTTSPAHIPQRTAGQFGELMDAVEAVMKYPANQDNVERLTKAHGTMVGERIEAMEKSRPVNLVVYYDLDAAAWRSFDRERLLMVMEASSAK